MRIREALWCGLVVALLALPAASPAQFNSGVVTVDATRTPLSEVLSILAAKSELNIVTSPEVEDRKITIHLKNTPIEEALNLVVRAAGLGYQRIGNSILVGNEQILATETGLTAYVIPLQFADAFEVVPMLEGIAENVAADQSGNRLVVVASPVAYEQITHVIEEIDVPPVQILLETEVVEVTTDDLMEFGIDWAKLTSQSVIISEGLPAPGEPNSPPDEMPWIDLDAGIDTDNLSRQTRTLELALDFLENEGKARILSRSTLATLNNRTAEIHIGDVIPYTVSGLTQTGLYEVSVEKEHIGVTVTVTPRASGDGYITALVEPNVSSIVGFKGPNDEIPWTKERRTSTHVRVKDGQTFMVAGLLSEDTSEEYSKVPLLGDIPILGYLFRHSKIGTRTSDLIIKVTPRIIP
jgi:type II secretory pathway component GspD/PulD (secretin)